MDNALTIALSKGRIFEETLPLLAAAGIVPKDDPETSRKLILDTNLDDVKLVIIRAADVPTYVGYGAADIGVAGKDVLMEHGGDGLYEPLDLGIARCRLMVAGPENSVVRNGVCGLPPSMCKAHGVTMPIGRSRWKSSSYTVPWSSRRWLVWQIVLLT